MAGVAIARVSLVGRAGEVGSNSRAAGGNKAFHDHLDALAFCRRLSTRPKNGDTPRFTRVKPGPGLDGDGAAGPYFDDEERQPEAGRLMREGALPQGREPQGLGERREAARVATGPKGALVPKPQDRFHTADSGRQYVL